MCARVVAKTFCEKCNKWVSNSNWKKHELAHQEHPERFEAEYHQHNSDFTCMFCGKQCKNSNSVLNHQNYCKQNPNRILTTFEKQGAIPNFNEKGRVSNRKGLTKETDRSVAKMCSTRKSRFEAGMYPKREFHHSEETKARLSAVARARGFGGKNYKSVIEYKGVKLDSSYELIVAQELDKHNISWVRPHRVEYITPDGKQHYYTPDFYLPEFDVYLEPKNDYLIENINPWLGYKDTEKIQWVMEQNNIIVLLLDKNNLEWSAIFNKICTCRSNSVV